MALDNGRRLLREVETACDIAFQPIVRVADRSVLGLEALIRPAGDPDETAADRLFEQAARFGVARQVETAAFRLAVDRFKHVRAGDNTLLFCNFSSVSFAAAPPPASSDIAICLEISEKRPIALADLLAWIDRWPSRPLVALDDFGTGWNGLASLRAIRPDFVKIDRLFVAGAAPGSHAERFLLELVRFSHALGSRVIIEGVETEAELFLCQSARCDFAQGFLLGRPSTSASPHADPAERQPTSGAGPDPTR